MVSSEPLPGESAQESRNLDRQCLGGVQSFESNEEKEHEAPREDASLCQEVFFFCKVKDVGDLPGAGCIYVETVVECYTGIAFAKVYSAKNAMNAVDILSSRVVPFFERHAIPIRELHTRKTSEYCGLLPVHPFETFLATSHIRHLGMGDRCQGCDVCEHFYRFLLKEFFLPALRKQFRLSLDDLQKDLDAFVDAFNALRMKHADEIKIGPPVSANFPVDL